MWANQSEQRREEEKRAENGATDVAQSSLQLLRRGGIRFQHALPAVLRSRGIQWAFLPEWSSHTAADLSNRGKHKILRWGTYGLAAAIAKQKNKVVSKHTVCRGKSISRWASNTCFCWPQWRGWRYRGEAAKVWQLPLLWGKKDTDT